MGRVEQGVRGGSGDRDGRLDLKGSLWARTLKVATFPNPPPPTSPRSLLMAAASRSSLRTSALSSETQICVPWARPKGLMRGSSSRGRGDGGGGPGEGPAGARPRVGPALGPAAPPSSSASSSM